MPRFKIPRFKIPNASSDKVCEARLAKNGAGDLLLILNGTQVLAVSGSSGRISRCSLGALAVEGLEAAGVPVVLRANKYRMVLEDL